MANNRLTHCARILPMTPPDSEDPSRKRANRALRDATADVMRKIRAGRRGFEAFAMMFGRAYWRLHKLKRATGAERVRMLTKALASSDHVLRVLAVEELAKTARPDSLPGIRTALQDPALRSSVLNAISKIARSGEHLDPEFRAPLLAELINQIVYGERQGDAIGAVLALSPEHGASELLAASSNAGRTFPPGIVKSILGDNWNKLRVPDLVIAAEAMLPARDLVEEGEVFDALTKRLAAEVGHLAMSDALKEAVESERQQVPCGGLSRTMRRIDLNEKSHWHKISALDSALEARFRRRGVHVGYNNDREQELRHMSHPEWVIRNLNSFLCGCENSGSLARQSHNGIHLAKYFEETGIAGCAKALRSFERLEKEETAREGSVPEDELFGWEHDERMRHAEREARPEGMEECCQLLWAYALRHADEILRDEGV